MRMIDVVGALAVVTACATPLSLHSVGNAWPGLGVKVDSVNAAELPIEPRSHHRAYRRGYYVAHYYRSYDPYCGGPYVGGGFNGGTYYGGAFIDLRCYGG